jgi:hypothetical protein
MAKQASWQTVSIKPLSGLLDVRSRPSDIPPGAFRWRQNWQTSSEGKLCTREGFSKSFPDLIYDNNGVLLSDPSHTGTGAFTHNHDLHHQGATREPITFEFESTDSSGVRRLYAGTKSRLYVLNEATGYWTTIASGQGGGDSYFRAAELQDTMIFVNGVNDVLYNILGTGTTQTIPDLQAMQVTAPNVVVEFQGFIFIMNMTEGGLRKRSRVRWCDLNLPLSWNPATPSSLATYQDLDYGEEILAAAPMMGSLYIYTRRSIWRVQVSGSATSTWSFTRIYNEPKNQAGCLLYPRTLVSSGSEHWYMSRDSVYTFNPYLPEPERPDWTRRADGVIYKKADTALSGVLCNAPCGEYRPGPHEVWFSWPSGNRLINNWTLVLNVEMKAADIIDNGFTAMVNYRRTPTLGLCNEVQSFLVASGIDYAIKAVGGGVFYREFLVMPGNNPTVDLDQNAPPTMYSVVGYTRILRGMIPLGLYDREKRVRNVLVDHDTSDQSVPCVLRLRIGNSFTLTDPNDPDPRCTPQWRLFADKPLACPVSQTNPQLTAKNQKPFEATHWPVFEQNNFLYFEISILNPDGSPAIGADSCFDRIDFDALARPKAVPV